MKLKRKKCADFIVYTECVTIARLEMTDKERGRENGRERDRDTRSSVESTGQQEMRNERMSHTNFRNYILI